MRNLALRIAAFGALLAFLGSWYGCHSRAPASAAPASTRAPASTTPSTAPASTAPASTAPASTAPASTAAVPAGAVPAMAPPMSAVQVIQVLDQTVAWYRTLGIQQQAASAPSDTLILWDIRQTANQVMALAFDIARANADILGKTPPATQDTGSDAAISVQKRSQRQKNFDAQSAATQAELDAQRRSLTTGSKKSRLKARATINELQGELDLINAKKQILGAMTGFATGTGGSSAASLKAQIDAMAVASPAANAATATNSTPAAIGSVTAQSAPAAANTPTMGRAGIWDLAANVVRLSEKAGTVAAIDENTAALQATIAEIRTPLVDQMKALSARGDALAAEADSADSNTLNGFRDQLDALTDQYKQTSVLLLPLSRERTLLNQCRHNLSSWHDAIESQYRHAIKALAIRLGGVLVVLAILFGAGDIWRRMVLRYIQESRRRYQLLLLRRIALWSLVVVVIGISFASELGSIATFAGLITAGIAVAMQSVLVSIVGYFFLIGKYGIRVGDRIQIGDVAGEVIDIGLVRMYLLELGGKGAMGPTGRVVAFANSVVFQVSSGLFKQIPGVNFSWRELTLMLPPGADYATLKEKLLAALTLALKEYRPEILRQTKEIERATSYSSEGGAEPQVQLHFASAGVEAHLRYPVNLEHAAEIDERVTEALAKVLATLPAGGAAALPTPLTS